MRWRERVRASRRVGRRPIATTRRAEPAQAGESAGETRQADRTSAHLESPASSGPRRRESRPRCDTGHLRPVRTAYSGVPARMATRSPRPRSAWVPPWVELQVRVRVRRPSCRPPAPSPPSRPGPPRTAPARSGRLLDADLHAPELNDIARCQPPRLPRQQPLLVDERPTGRVEIANRQLLPARGERGMKPGHLARRVPFLVDEIKTPRPVQGIARDRLARLEYILMPHDAATNDLERPASSLRHGLGNFFRPRTIHVERPRRG